ncbi:peptide deformylase [Cellulomonas sp. NPDC089187]|uniref:peptide deformylase n=1 Tax=Cellulomonas sp. NPDC089187 TaxID=3154970 RepID=UPI003417DC83
MSDGPATTQAQDSGWPAAPGSERARQSTWTDEVLREQVAAVLALAAQDPSGIVPIVQAGHPALRMRAVPLTGQLDPDTLAELIAVMRRTMHAAPGVGLAAPQIGLPIALAVIADPGAGDPEVAAVRERPELPFRVLVNPRYEPVPGEDVVAVSFYEGCLSVDGYQAVVPRLRRLRLICADEHGNAVDEIVQGWPARIVQHETDHLAGVLYLDRALTRSLSTVEEFGGHWAGAPHPDEAARILGF